MNAFATDFSAPYSALLFNREIKLYFCWFTICFQDVIGKTDHEILSGEGIDEMNKVKREVMAKGIPIKREFLFNTPLFGPKTFVVYIEPVFSKIGETIGVNYVALDITDQAICYIHFYHIHVSSISILSKSRE